MISDRDLERSMEDFDRLQHEGLLADRRERAAQTLAQALVYAEGAEERSLVADILGIIDAAGLEGAYRVGGCASQGIVVRLWRCGDAKRPGAAELRDEVRATLARAGLHVAMVGSWDMDVRRMTR